MRVDVEVKKSAIIPTAIGKTGSVKRRPVVDGPGNGFPGGQAQLPILDDFVSDPGEGAGHGVSSGRINVLFVLTFDAYNGGGRIGNRAKASGNRGIYDGV